MHLKNLQAPPVARGGRQAPCRDCGPGPAAVARGPGDRPRSPPQRATGLVFFLQGLRCKFEKKLHIGPVALWEGDRGIFLKYLETDIYF